MSGRLKNAPFTCSERVSNSPFEPQKFLCLTWLKTWNNATYCTVKTHCALLPACDYMGRCNYIANGLARKVGLLMPQVVCYLRPVFAPNSVPLCIVSAEAKGPATEQKYSQWWRILEWIAWFNKTSSKGKLLTMEPSAFKSNIMQYNGNEYI